MISAVIRLLVRHKMQEVVYFVTNSANELYLMSIYIFIYIYIYIFICKLCNDQYVGSAYRNNFRSRFRVHKSDINTVKDRCGVDKHVLN